MTKGFLSNIFLKDPTLIDGWASQTKTTVILQDFKSIIITAILQLF